MTERVLVVAAHPDDEVLGCGGTIARHAAEGDDVHIIFAADGETARVQAARHNRNMDAQEAMKVLGAKSVFFCDYRDQMLDTLPLIEITRKIEEEGRRLRPTIVYTHHAGDLNQDHRIVHQATMTAFRPLPESPVHAIYTFEVLSSTEWGAGFVPNHFVDITDYYRVKLEALNCYHNEMRPYPHARSLTSVNSLTSMRGASIGRERAEAFMTMRTIR